MANKIWNAKTAEPLQRASKRKKNLHTEPQLGLLSGLAGSATSTTLRTGGTNESIQSFVQGRRRSHYECVAT